MPTVDIDMPKRPVHFYLPLHELLITCSPENIASRLTLERLGGELVETVPVPRCHWLYARGETWKNIYRFQLL